MTTKLHILNGQHFTWIKHFKWVYGICKLHLTNSFKNSIYYKPRVVFSAETDIHNSLCWCPVFKSFLHQLFPLLQTFPFCLPQTAFSVRDTQTSPLTNKLGLQLSQTFTILFSLYLDSSPAQSLHGCLILSSTQKRRLASWVWQIS